MATCVISSIFLYLIGCIVTFHEFNVLLDERRHRNNCDETLQNSIFISNSTGSTKIMTVLKQGSIE